jgi:O-acetyl-ADP-ribose deacetylase (regulator of RNase III)
MIEIAQGDVLSSKADAIVLTIDGAKRGMEGNIARGFARRWPDAWMEIEDEIRYPIPLGRSIAVCPENDSGFRLVLIASTLNHIDTLNESQKTAIVRSALSEAILLAKRHHARRIATAPMTGGWRLEMAPALSAMMSVLRSTGSVDHAHSVVVHLLSREHTRLATEIATRHGIDVPIGNL